MYNTNERFFNYNIKFSFFVWPIHCITCTSHKQSRQFSYKDGEQFYNHKQFLFIVANG